MSINKKILIGLTVIFAIGAIVLNVQKNNSREDSENIKARQTLDLDNVEIKTLSGESQFVKNITQRYQLSVPSEWYIEKSQSSEVGFRVLPPNECKQILIHKLPNPEKKGPEEFFTSITDPGEIEYVIEPYPDRADTTLVRSRGLIFPFIKIEAFISYKDFMYALSVVSDPPQKDACLKILKGLVESFRTF